MKTSAEVSAPGVPASEPIATSAPRARLKRWLFFCVRYCGLAALLRETVQRHCVSVLMFHDMKPDAARRVFDYLQTHYSLISLNDYLRALDRQGPPLPKKALIITFDDGHVGNYQLLPLFAERRIPVTIFVCAGIVGTRRHYWFTHSHPDYSVKELKQLPNVERLRLLKQVGFDPLCEYGVRQALSAEHIATMKEVVDFQAHTLFHPCLPNCSDQEAWQEIVQSKAQLEKDHDLNINAFAYPNGDYSERETTLTERAGFRCALTVDFGYNTLRSDRYRLKRIGISDDANSLDEVVVRASGLWALLKTLVGKTRTRLNA